MSGRIPKFHRLAVREVRRETPSAVSIAFSVPPHLAADYAFTPGQHLTLRALLDGEDVRRSYSICSTPDDGELRIAVKRVEQGIFSAWLNEGIRSGDEIEVMTPMGRFGLGELAGDEGPRTFVAFAAGSGVTPILSIVRDVLRREPNSRFFLFYGNRSADEVLFGEAIEELKDRFLDRFSIFHVFSREEREEPILNGRLDREKARLLLRFMVPAATIEHAFICGPATMIDELETTLAELGIAKDRIHVERFASATGGRPRTSPARIATNAAPRHVALVIVDGKRREVPMAEGEAVLDAALRAGMDLPFACKGGMCATCRAKLVEGTADMDINYSLEPWELEEGFILTCQARPKSERIVVDFDQV